MKPSLFHRLAWVVVIALLVACQPDTPPEPDPQPVPETTAQAESPTPPVPATGASQQDSDLAVDCRMQVGWDPWQPYHYQAVGGEIQGLDVDILRRVSEPVGCELEFVQGNWQNLLQLLQAGDLDIMMGATRTAEREEFADFSGPYREESFQLFVLADDLERFGERSLAELLESGFRLGTTQGYYYGQDVQDLLNRGRFADQIIEAAVGELNFTHLLDRRIDGFIEDPYVAAAISRRRSDGNEVVEVQEPLATGPVSFMFSKSSVSSERVERLDAELQKLRESGELERLSARYLE